VFVLPVIDLMQGLVVHGRGGQRHNYQAIRSGLATNAQPASIATAFSQQLGIHRAYVADLDAIAGAQPDWSSYDQIAEVLPELWIDAGVRRVESAVALISSQSSPRRIHPICALETLSSLETLRKMLARLGPERLIVSLDLCQGRVRSPMDRWSNAPPTRVASDLIQLGVRRLIVLDVAHVGLDRGTGTRHLTREIKRMDAEIEITCGGGISTLPQLQELADDGCDAVLIATALHNGRLGRHELRQLR
jgi:phosphoribosylformimino-5-aminoimidazole carboxamide ribotide isomerase